MICKIGDASWHKLIECLRRAKGRSRLFSALICIRRSSSLLSQEEKKCAALSGRVANAPLGNERRKSSHVRGRPLDRESLQMNRQANERLQLFAYEPKIVNHSTREALEHVEGIKFRVAAERVQPRTNTNTMPSILTTF